MQHAEVMPFGIKNVGKLMLFALIGVGVSMLIVLIASFVVASSDSYEGAILPVSIMSGAAGALVTGLLSVSALKKKGIISGAIAGAVFYLTEMVAGMAVTQSVPKPGVEMVIMLAVIFPAAMLGGIIRANKRRD